MSLIRFTPSQLEARCRSRGVTLDAVEPAIASRDSGHVYLDDQHDAYQAIRLGLGDRVAAVTKALHIPECGGCKKRREWLNAAGRRVGIG